MGSTLAYAPQDAHSQVLRAVAQGLTSVKLKAGTVTGCLPIIIPPHTPSGFVLDLNGADLTFISKGGVIVDYWEDTANNVTLGAGDISGSTLTRASGAAWQDNTCYLLRETVINETHTDASTRHPYVHFFKTGTHTSNNAPIDRALEYTFNGTVVATPIRCCSNLQIKNGTLRGPAALTLNRVIDAYAVDGLNLHNVNVSDAGTHGVKVWYGRNMTITGASSIDRIGAADAYFGVELQNVVGVNSAIGVSFSHVQSGFSISQGTCNVTIDGAGTTFGTTSHAVPSYVDTHGGRAKNITVQNIPDSANLNIGNGSWRAGTDTVVVSGYAGNLSSGNAHGVLALRASTKGATISGVVNADCKLECSEADTASAMAGNGAGDGVVRNVVSSGNHFNRYSGGATAGALWSTAGPSGNCGVVNYVSTGDIFELSGDTPDGCVNLAPQTVTSDLTFNTPTMIGHAAAQAAVVVQAAGTAVQTVTLNGAIITVCGKILNNLNADASKVVLVVDANCTIGGVPITPANIDSYIAGTKPTARTVGGAAPG